MSGYEGLRNGVAWIDLNGRGRFRVSGEDRVRLLHAMTTNHIEQMKPGESCYAFFLNPQGRILGDANLLCLADHFLLDTEAETHDVLFAHLDKYIIADDVVLEDAREDTIAIGLEGPLAEERAAGIAGVTVGKFSTTGRGVRLFAPRGTVVDLDGIPQASAEEQKVVRLENFRPRYGDDFGEKQLVHETQLLHAVHFTKGCYIGQEIVERVRSRGQVHRLLVPLYVEGTEAPARGSVVMAGDAAVGETGSAAYSPGLGKCAAFGFVRSEQVAVGNKLMVDGREAEVAGLKGM